MFPSPSSSQNADGTLLRRMLIESTGLGLQQQLKQRQQDVNEYAITEQGIMDSRRLDPTDNQLEDVPGHGRMGGSGGGYSWDSVIADAMLSMTASPLVHHSRGRHDVGLAGASALGTDYDSDAGGRELSLSPRGLDDADVNEDDDDQNDMLGLSMDQDSSGSGLNESTSSAVTGLADQSGSSGSSEHHPRKKGRPSKFGLSGIGPHSGVECPVCNKLFNNSSALAKHKLTHSTERKYACRICSKTFKRQDHLNGHMLTHSSKKPFECRYPSCGRSYCDARSLRRHHDNYHSRPGSSASLPIGADSLVTTSGNSNQSPFSGVSLAQSDGGLQIGSELISSGSYDSELQFECELCFRRFKNLPALNGHMRLHGGYFKKDMPPATGDASRSASRSESKPSGSPDSQPFAEATFVPAARSQSSSIDVTNQWIGSNLLLPSGHIVGTTFADMQHAAAAAQSAATSSALSLAGSAVLPLNVVAGDMSGLLGLAAAQSQAAAAASGSLLPGSLVSGPLGLFRLSNNLLLPVDNMNTANLLSGLSRGTAADGNEIVTVADVAGVKSEAFGNIAPAMVIQKPIEGGRMQETNVNQMDSLYQSLLSVSDRNSLGNSQNTDGTHHIHNASLDISNISKLVPGTESQFRFLVAPTSSANFPAIHQLLQQNQASSSEERNNAKPDLKHDPKVPLHVITDSTMADMQYLNRRRWTSADADVLRRPRRWDLIDDVDPNILGRQESVGFELTEGLYPSALPFDEPEVGSPSAADADIDEEKANFSGEFSAPAGMGLHHKFRRKHRPEPLIIPSPVTGTHFAFQSRLRSPRICDHPGSLISAASAAPVKSILSSSSFTPYTPPPMLSPLRTGSGLFCSLVEPSPKSAPVGFRLGLFHRNSLSISTNAAQAPNAASIIEEEEEEEEEVEEPILDVPHIETEEVIHEIDLEPPPQTDILPHINVGPEYQADIPGLCSNRERAFRAPDWSDLVWDPAVMKHVSEEDVRHLMDFACCAAVHGSGANKEYAHHLLYLCKGNVKLAALKLMKLEPCLPKDHTLHSYVYQETSVWNADEIEAYQNAMMKFDKDFFRVAQQVGTKSVRECTAFYWLWKKVCVEEWRRMRILRRKRIQDSMYHLRSSDQDAAKTFGNEAEFIADGSDQKGLDYLDDVGDASGTEGMNSQPPSPRRQVVSEQCVVVERPVQVIQQPQQQQQKHHHPPPQPPPPKQQQQQQQQQQQPQQQQPQQLFPCRICGKVFDRVKSRSAHMKSHRQIEPDTHHHRSTLPFSDVYR